MNDTFLPNKMTKSYLLESDPYLKTSSKTSPFGCDDGAFRGSNVWSGQHHFHHSNDLISDRPSVKPLAMHNVPSNVPPIAFINGNSVRPVRCRHYSQQQTVFHNNNTGNNINNNNNNNNSSNSEKPSSGIKVAAGDMPHYAQSNGNGVNEFGGDDKAAIAGQSTGRAMNGRSPHKNVPSKSASSKVKVQFADEAASSRSAPAQQQQPSPVKQRSKSPSRQSPSSIRDYVTNNENESSIYSLYENADQVIEHLAKRIEGVMRSAKESRRLVCTELLVPTMLTAQIASDVIELAESEPCGLRGCLLYICMEDTSSSGQAGGSKHHHKSSTSDHSHQSDSSHSVASRLLGEVALDRSIVPTFEVFLTLKRASLNWFESLENKLFGKDPLVISELYLLHKKKLYQTSSSPTM